MSHSKNAQYQKRHREKVKLQIRSGPTIQEQADAVIATLRERGALDGTNESTALVPASHSTTPLLLRGGTTIFHPQRPLNGLGTPVLIQNNFRIVAPYGDTAFINSLTNNATPSTSTQQVSPSSKPVTKGDLKEHAMEVKSMFKELERQTEDIAKIVRKQPLAKEKQPLAKEQHAKTPSAATRARMNPRNLLCGSNHEVYPSPLGEDWIRHKIMENKFQQERDAEYALDEMWHLTTPNLLLGDLAALVAADMDNTKPNLLHLLRDKVLHHKATESYLFVAESGEDIPHVEDSGELNALIFPTMGFPISHHVTVEYDKDGKSSEARLVIISGTIAGARTFLAPAMLRLLHCLNATTCTFESSAREGTKGTEAIPISQQELQNIVAKCTEKRCKLSFHKAYITNKQQIVLGAGCSGGYLFRMCAFEDSGSCLLDGKPTIPLMITMMENFPTVGLVNNLKLAIANGVVGGLVFQAISLHSQEEVSGLKDLLVIAGQKLELNNVECNGVSNAQLRCRLLDQNAQEMADEKKKPATAETRDGRDNSGHTDLADHKHDAGKSSASSVIALVVFVSTNVVTHLSLFFSTNPTAPVTTSPPQTIPRNCDKPLTPNSGNSLPRRMSATARSWSTARAMAILSTPSRSRTKPPALSRKSPSPQPR